MALVRAFYSRQGEGEVESFALARDVVTDRVFILHSTERSKPEFSQHEVQVTLGDFFQTSGPEQLALLDLIGTLVVEE